MYGVSPAFVISLYGESFSWKQFKSSLSIVESLGFSAFQGEVFRADHLESWFEFGSAEVAAEAVRLGLTASQFVAHFLLYAFEDERAIVSGYGTDLFSRFCDMVQRDWPTTEVVSVPLPPLQEPVTDHTRLATAYLEKLEVFSRIAGDHGVLFAVEMLPGGFFTGTGHLATILRSDLAGVQIGLNFDTGHAMASKERVDLVPHRLPILGTHLCDNDGHENRSDVPGDGSIDWSATFAALDRVGYSGSYDIEVRCAPDDVVYEYARALAYIRSARSVDLHGKEVAQ